MPIPLPALIGLVWILVCAVWFVLAVRRSPGTGAGSQRYPGLILNAIGLIALTPIVSAVQYRLTGRLDYWAGGWVLFFGLAFLAYHFLLVRRSAGGASRPAATAFREKSIVVQILSILAVYGYFGVRLWGFWDQPGMSSSTAELVMTAATALISITICMIVIAISAHVALALYARVEAPDERDQLIDLRGSRHAYRALAAGLWLVLLLAIIGMPHGALFYTVMAAFALAELVRLGSQLLYYRLDA